MLICNERTPLAEKTRKAERGKEMKVLKRDLNTSVRKTRSKHDPALSINPSQHIQRAHPLSGTVKVSVNSNSAH